MILSRALQVVIVAILLVDYPYTSLNLLLPSTLRFSSTSRHDPGGPHRRLHSRYGLQTHLAVVKLTVALTGHRSGPPYDPCPPLLSTLQCPGVYTNTLDYPNVHEGRYRGIPAVKLH